MTKDTLATVRAIARMGYEVVEFYGPYYAWTPDFVKDVRKMMDETGIRCNSTHNDARNFRPDGIQKAIDYNKTLGAKYVVMASSGNVSGLDGWKGVGETLTTAMEKLRPAGLRAGYHNHQTEFKPLDGKRPIEVIAANTPKDVMLQFDVGTCVEVGGDPVAWINANPGRINSLHSEGLGSGRGHGQGEGLSRSVRRGRVAVAGDLRGGGEDRRGGILPDRAGGQPLSEPGDGAALPGQLQENAGVGCRSGMAALPSRQGPAESRLQPAIGCPTAMVKWKVLPTPGWLSSQIRPPIIDTSRPQMLRPRPVPP